MISFPRTALISLVALLFILAQPLYAEVSKDSPYYSTYQTILGDLGSDIQTFDGYQMSASDRDQLAKAWQAFTGDPSRGNPLPQTQSAFQGIWPPKALGLASDPHSQKETSLKTARLKIPTIDNKQESLKSPIDYAANRLGQNLSQMIQAKKVSVEIYGGTEQSLAQISAGRKLQRIPSLYESWGISKFLDITPGQSIPKVVICVPPIEQYVYHHGLLVRVLGGTLDSAKLNTGDHATYRRNLHESVSNLYSKLPAKPDYVILGYGGEFDKQLRSGSSPWILQGEPAAISAPGGLTGTLYQASNRSKPEIKRSFLTAMDTQTLWGEGSTFLAEAFVEQRPRGLLFFGSAGSTDPNQKVYEVTVPSEFHLQDNRQVAIANTLNTFQGSRDPDLRYGVKHGNSPSPAAETIGMIQEDLKEGITTVDVEQSRVADAVAKFNREQNGNVLFGAANIVTDRPGKAEDAGHDLDVIDPALKTKARSLAVSSTLASIDQRSQWEESADQIRIQAVKSAIPKIDPAFIHIENGQGKIDADPKNKLSYYVFTANPRDPASPTLLIPMATSRFDKYNYSTDEWWDAHQEEIQKAKLEHTPMPHQDPNEVKAYLEANGLSTNPDVIKIDSRSGQVSREPLREFLMKEYMSRFNDGKYVWLYRGGAKADELAQWKAGTFPRGVRYWTPDIDYGWRYGRVHPDFYELLAKDETPVFKYAVPIDDFKRLVQGNHLILGTELTKHAHDSFDYSKRFTDQLTNYDYLGEGKYGLEFELRGKRVARDAFPAYFRGAVTVDELADGRIKDIQESTQRLALQRPGDAEALMKTQATRIARTNQERTVLKLVHDKADPKLISDALTKLTPGPSEIANIDGVSLEAFALNKPSIPFTPPGDLPVLLPTAGPEMCSGKEIIEALKASLPTGAPTLPPAGASAAVPAPARPK